MRRKSAKAMTAFLLACALPVLASCGRGAGNAATINNINFISGVNNTADNPANTVNKNINTNTAVNKNTAVSNVVVNEITGNYTDKQKALLQIFNKNLDTFNAIAKYFTTHEDWLVSRAGWNIKWDGVTPPEYYYNDPIYDERTPSDIVAKVQSLYDDFGLYNVFTKGDVPYIIFVYDEGGDMVLYNKYASSEERDGAKVGLGLSFIEKLQPYWYLGTVSYGP